MKERENKGERQTETQRERGRGKEIDGETESKDEGTTRQSLVLMQDMSLKRRRAPRSDTGHVLCFSSIVVIQTTSRLLVRNGAPTLQVEQGLSHDETPP